MTDWLNTPVIVVAVLAVGALVWKIAYWVAKVDLAAKDFGAFTAKTFPAFAKEIRDDIKQILLRLPPPTPIESGSPARLSEYGRKMAAFLRAEEWAAGIAATAVREVVGKRPFEIEIEEFSRRYVESNLDPKIEERVAACAYEFGTERDRVKPVLWVVLRDELMQRVEQTRS